MTNLRTILPQFILPLFALIAVAMAPQAHARRANLPATVVQDQSALEKILGNEGISMQWLGWTEERGLLDAFWIGKTLHLKGSQSQKDGTGKLFIDGYVVRVDKTSFIFRGTISITDSPDQGRKCTKNGDSPFAITQNRKYWRMREFEWCDYLTDYIDIYF